MVKIRPVIKDGRGEGFDPKKQKGILGAERNVLYLDYSDDYIHYTLCIHHIRMMNLM